jgi:hypothetical protein
MNQSMKTDGEPDSTPSGSCLHQKAKSSLFDGFLKKRIAFSPNDAFTFDEIDRCRSLCQ